MTENVLIPDSAVTTRLRESSYLTRQASESAYNKKANPIKSYTVEVKKDASASRTITTWGMNSISSTGSSESVIYPSSITFIWDKIQKLRSLIEELAFENDVIFKIGSEIIRDLAAQGKFSVQIIRTGEDEIAFYIKNGREFKNLILDEDGDIEFLHITEKREDTYNEIFPFDENFDTFSLTSKL
ncbi:MAG: hypothetical protein GC193_14135 [Cryomorphaceae bacterium]|nr:hypothetical protein [Cryomorphaceae bacterium]